MSPTLLNPRFPPPPQQVAHGNTARFAKEARDPVAARMLGLIAGDEGRHEVAYQKIIEEILCRDPDGGVLAYADMMRKRITMPAHLMDDGEHRGRTGGALRSPGASTAAVTAPAPRPRACPAPNLRDGLLSCST